MGKQKTPQANKLLKKALQEKATSLDLGYCDLRGNEEYLAELQECTALKTLILADRWHELQPTTPLALLPEEKTSANFRSKHNNALGSGLPNLLHALPALPPNLQKLIARGQYRKKGRYILEYKFFRFSPAPLAGLQRLRYLNLSRNQLVTSENLMGIGQKMLTVEVLVLNDCRITNLDFLGYFPNLKALHLEGNQISDLSPIKKHLRPEVLEVLNLKDNHYEAVSALSEFTKLRYLNLSKNPNLESLPTAKLPNLEFLSLHFSKNLLREDGSANMLSDIPMLFPSLRGLALNGLLLESAPFLAELPKLELLRLTRNRFRSLAFLPPKGLPQLERLELKYNPLEKIDLQFLKDKFPKLKYFSGSESLTKRDENNAEKEEKFSAFELALSNTEGTPKLQITLEGSILEADELHPHPSDFFKPLAKLNNDYRMSQDRNQIFVSYSHDPKDELYFGEIKTALDGLPSLDPFFEGKVWYDVQLRSSDDWFEEIKQNLLKTKIGILLISPGFLASDFIKKHETPKLLSAVNEGAGKIIPVIVRPSPFNRHPELKKYQSLNNPQRALSEMTQPERERHYAKLVDDIFHLYGMGENG